MDRIKGECRRYTHIQTLTHQHTHTLTHSQALEALDRIKGEYRRYYDTAMDLTRAFDAGIHPTP